MSNNEPPPGSGDRTIIRPTPGRRSGGSSATARPQQPGGPNLSGQGAVATGDAPDLDAFGASTLNPLVQASTPLLVLATGLRGTREHRDVDGLRAQAVREIQAFEQSAAERGVASESVLAARYALCTFIDEVVMNTPWGARSAWADRPLLLTFHRDSAGGDKVFELVERVLADREPRRDIIEFFYVCLALGLQGRYRVADGGQATLAELQERLYGRIRAWRDAPPDELSPHWRGVEDRRARLVRAVPAWVLAAAVALIGGGVFLTLHNWLNAASTPLTTQLNAVKEATFESPAGPRAVEGPTLASVLEAGDRERLHIETGPDGRTTLILHGEVFASASTEVTEEFVPVLEEIAEALNRVRGPVLVEGHSDDRPIRSVRFRDNHELSRKRAASAAELLREILVDPERVDYVGLGADRPRFEPADDPGNRALNRRVEIVHRPGGGGS
ncbi:type IVB secretion system protein IcmH/DotU [Aquisalimonas sp.]|uniref:type IVB secretion system protein IcmH/DotU n=1 Tax=Aquisalimonas sp. TaxID=1872621 RepID=UPI0025C3C4E8|nr:type IVB secretion system protein IcmH/DotU [Aquisalimonas sp.]